MREREMVVVVVWWSALPGEVTARRRAPAPLRLRSGSRLRSFPSDVVPTSPPSLFKPPSPCRLPSKKLQDVAQADFPRPRLCRRCTKKKKKKKDCHACASGSLLCQSVYSKLCTTWPRIHGFAMMMPLLHATFLSMSDITRRTFRFQVASTRKTCQLLCKTNIPTSVAGTTQRPSPHGVRLLSSFNIRPLPVVLTAVFTIKLIQASMCWCGAAPWALQTWLISLSSK
ncbi:uncharacterized protein IWZ02DRAFT_15991 [Phyllosticta citriasiana]|uniref:uncharacterized protein n=1 Tax=Phyllosticta citriasiana TaxID=595635 RepID=UPI0030FD86EC